MSETWAGPQTRNDTIGTQGQECPHLATRTPEFSATFYETLAEAREKCPVAWDETNRCWFVVGGQTLFDVAHDWETYSSALGVGGPQFPQLLPMDADPPRHRDWRRVLNPFFTKKILEATEAGIRAIAERLVGQLPAEGPVEMAAAFARPLPGQVFFSQILDLPDDELEHCQELVERAVLLGDVEQMVSLERPHNRHYAFGVGIHRCLGSNLARLVLRVALEVLLERLRDIEVADGFQPVYHPVGVRSLESLDLTFRIEQPAAA